MSSLQASLVSIFRYPVKSMMGEELNSVSVSERGLAGDRAYALVDLETGMLVNAKNPQKWPEMFSFRASFVSPSMPPASVAPVFITLPSGDVVESTAANIDEKLSTALGRKVALKRPDDSDRTFEGFVPTVEGVSDHDFIFNKVSPSGTFFDIGLLHLLTTSTLDALRRVIPQSRIETRRFRPNMVIQTQTDGFTENQWVGRELRVGEVVLRVKQPTQRCVMTTLAQGDLPKDLSILKTIYQQNGGMIGAYAEVVRAGTVHRGDSVELS